MRPGDRATSSAALPAVELAPHARRSRRERARGRRAGAPAAGRRRSATLAADALVRADRSIVSSATTASCSSPRTSCTAAARLANFGAASPTLARRAPAPPPRRRSAPAWRACARRGSARPGSSSLEPARRRAPASSRTGRASGGSAVRAGAVGGCGQRRRRGGLHQPVEQRPRSAGCAARRAARSRATSRRASSSSKKRLEAWPEVLAVGAQPLEHHVQVAHVAERGAEPACSSSRSCLRPLGVDQVAEGAQVAAQPPRADAHLVQRLDLAEAGARVVQDDALHAPARSPPAPRTRPGREGGCARGTRTSGGAVARCPERAHDLRHLLRRAARRRARSPPAIRSSASRSIPRPSISISRKRSATRPALEHRDAVVDELGELCAVGPVQAPPAPARAQPRNRRELGRAHERPSRGPPRPAAPRGPLPLEVQLVAAVGDRRRRPAASRSSRTRRSSPVRLRSVMPCRASRRSGVS